jgi:hypothetical protein
MWLAPDRANERSIFEKALAPNASIAPGWGNWILEHMPFLFYRFAQESKDKYNSNYRSGATDWLRNRVIGKAKLREGQTVVTMQAVDGKAEVTIADGTKLRIDHVLQATGYKVDINKLTMIHPSLRAAIKADMSIPILSHSFETSVPGLYFVGLTSMRAFGPLFRFVAGCRAAARRVASSVARSRIGRSRLSVARRRALGDPAEIGAPLPYR